MEDSVPSEVREEPSETIDLLENGRSAIRKEAGKSILLGGGIVFLHLILLGVGVISLRVIFRSILFVLGFAIITEGIWEVRRARNLTLEDLKPTEQEKLFSNNVATRRDCALPSDAYPGRASRFMHGLHLYFPVPHSPDRSFADRKMWDRKIQRADTF